MTFATENVRILFHQLPAETQLNYQKLEKRLAKSGDSLNIEGIIRHERILEVILRITTDLEYSGPIKAD
jgi:hypothetical protein